MSANQQKRIDELQRKLRPLEEEISKLDSQIKDLEWIWEGREQRAGVWRSDAEAERNKLIALKRSHESHAAPVRQELGTLRREAAAAEERQQEAAERDRWANTPRSERVAECHRFAIAVKAAETVLRQARDAVARQLERLAECDAAKSAVVVAQAVLVEAQCLAWLNRTAEAEAAERNAAAGLAAAEEQAQRASAARRHIDAEVALARDAAAAAESALEATRQRETAARLALARFDWNEAIANLKPAFEALAAIDRRTASDLSRAMEDGPPVFDHRFFVRRATWTREILR